jgi:hypothetical protein
MLHTTNYRNTFIEVADDCNATIGTVPPLNPQKKSAARMQYEMLSEHPYVFTSDDLLFLLHAQKQSAPESEHDSLRSAFFSKGQPCMRASDLPKKYGWGIHFNAEEHMAIVPLDSPDYEVFRNDLTLSHKKAMRSSKA